MKLITFTVPCYNSAAYMRHCIESLLPGGNQVEIIIIDDGSTDDTGAIADEYAARYPEIVRVVHQPNGGHGEGINQGLARATGRFFKVIDSDDWVDETAYRRVLARLATLPEDCDLVVCNYTYRHDDPRTDHTMHYRNVFPEDQVITWHETRHFRAQQLLQLHNCIFSVDVLKRADLKLPKFIFYEDNYFVYVPMPLVRKLCYLDTDLYQYYVSREGQSVSAPMLARRCTHQITIAKLVFAEHDLDALKQTQPKLARYLRHAMSFMVLLAIVFTRSNRTDEAEELLRQMWSDLKATNPRQARYVRWCTLAFWVSFPGKAGRAFALWLYNMAHKIVKFN